MFRWKCTITWGICPFILVAVALLKAPQVKSNLDEVLEYFKEKKYSGIRDILVLIRIQIRGSVPLTNGSGSGSNSGSGSFLH